MFIIIWFIASSEDDQLSRDKEFEEKR